MTLIEHARLVLRYQLDTLSLHWDGGNEDSRYRVDQIDVSPSGGYLVRISSPEGVPEVFDIPNHVMHDADVERVEDDPSLGLIVSTCSLSCDCGESASSLLIEHGIDVEALNLSLVSAVSPQPQYKDA